MISLNEKSRLMGLLPEFQLLTGAADAEQIKGIGAIEAASVEEVLTASEMGLGRREIFFTAHTAADAAAVLDKCRFVANSMDDLIAINEASAAAGVITMVGLRLTAVGFQGDAMTVEQLRGLVHDIKQLKAISVCGCMIMGGVEGLHGKALGKYVRSSYQTAKDMTYILPCSMPYICIENCLEAIARNKNEHPETFGDFLTAANIVGMQNSTAFYADYYMQ